MKILLNNQSLFKELRPFDDIGFVPTMGSIHDGHISLINQSLKKCTKTIVSIFVNPKQFNNKNDFKKYPLNIKRDLSILKKYKGIDFIYIPSFKDIYKSPKKPKIIINQRNNVLCAKFRKGHFEGVLDVMDRLTNLIKPKKIFMGKKDFQQFFFVKSLIEKKYQVKVIGCKTIRNDNKLALSSRNSLIHKNDLSKLENISKKLFYLKKIIKKKKNINLFLNKTKKKIEKLFRIKIEYLENRREKNLALSNKIYGSKIFISYYFKGVRLIDNF